MIDNATILIVDDEESQREAIAGFLRKLGHNTVPCPDGADALEIIQKEPVDLVISDMKMPVMGGLELLRKAKSIVPDLAFILMTAFGSVDGAVECMKLGAFNYLTKPIDLDELEINVTKALENRRLLAENRELRELVKSKGEIKGIVSASGKWMKC